MVQPSTYQILCMLRSKFSRAWVGKRQSEEARDKKVRMNDILKRGAALISPHINMMEIAPFFSCSTCRHSFSYAGGGGERRKSNMHPLVSFRTLLSCFAVAGIIEESWRQNCREGRKIEILFKSNSQAFLLLAVWILHQKMQRKHPCADENAPLPSASDAGL